MQKYLNLLAPKISPQGDFWETQGLTSPPAGNLGGAPTFAIASIFNSLKTAFSHGIGNVCFFMRTPGCN